MSPSLVPVVTRRTSFNSCSGARRHTLPVYPSLKVGQRVIPKNDQVKSQDGKLHDGRSHLVIAVSDCPSCGVRLVGLRGVPGYFYEHQLKLG